MNSVDKIIGSSVEKLSMYSDFKKCLELVEQEVISCCCIDKFWYFIYYDTNKDELFYYIINPETGAWRKHKANLYYFLKFRLVGGNLNLYFFHTIKIENVPWLISTLLEAEAL